MTLRILDAQGNPFETPLGDAPQINRGKTKLVHRFSDRALAIVHRDVITANDDPMYTGNAPGKGVASAYSTALLFRILEQKGVPTSHIGFLNANTTLDRSLDMRPFELIWRRYNVDGNSWMKRHPDNTYAVGQRYDDIIYEACLKWSVRLSDGWIVHDPFLVLDAGFRPQLRPDGMPRLIHSKEPLELEYVGVLHPNRQEDISDGEVKRAIAGFASNASDIRDMLGQIQQVTFDTYAEIGRWNADGKVEMGTDPEWRLLLGDELELDSLRNISARSVEVVGVSDPIVFDHDLLGESLAGHIRGGASAVTRILSAHHSGKQAYRDKMKQVDADIVALRIAWGDSPDETHYAEVRKQLNDASARRVTEAVYIPVALALSERFGGEVGYVLSRS